MPKITSLVVKRMSRTLKRIKEALRRRMHANVEDTARWLGRVLRPKFPTFSPLELTQAVDSDGKIVHET